MEQVQRHFEWHQQDQQHQLTSGLWINHFTGHNCGLVTSPTNREAFAEKCFRTQFNFS